eukprot:TRINITY_DN2947_c0_g1_i1.p1 TRINITY_DN2947_c0_g1~~TRINITY_DN2947_c0_g1_i1.p1  ORF type:complete len:577 (-),score=113.15 TRINITY_DN2947_c0_g1_i1:162-1892(-)
MSRFLIFGLLGVAFIAEVAAHGHLSVPQNRGYTKRQDENNAPVAYPLASDFVCRSDPAMPSNMWTTLTAGATSTVQWALEAPHPGDCFLYLSYDADASDTQKKWFKIAQWDKCNYLNLQNLTYTVPSYLPSCEHCILRWEWYALHLRDINIVEFYSQCADVKINGKASGGQLPTPQVTIPGHIPMGATNYRSDTYQPTLTKFTGPPVATIGGAAYDCVKSYDNSCNVAPVTNNPCTISNQRCVTSTTYQACGIGATTTIWGPEQPCQTGLVCYPNTDGAHIYCGYPTADYVPPTTPGSSSSSPSSTPTPATPSPSTPSPSTPTQAPSGVCTEGEQTCTGDSTYHTCSRGVSGNFWSSDQSCQSGLYCVENGAYVYCSREQPKTSSMAATTGKAAVKTVTTGKKAPSTTGKPKASSTTGKPKASSTTGSVPASGGSTQMCYKPDAPNVNGTIYVYADPQANPMCGKGNRKDSRCADGQCCSEKGYCGPIARADGTFWEQTDPWTFKQVTADIATKKYCTNNQGDYRKIPCDQVANYQPDVNSPDEDAGRDPAAEGSANTARTFAAVAIATLFAVSLW